MKKPKIKKFRLAEGRLFSYWCPDCQEYNGGGVDGPEFRAWREHDKYSPLVRPCLWCGKGPMVMIYEEQGKAQ